MARNTTRRPLGATRKALVSESVNFGHDLAGTIRQTDRAFEVFGPANEYLFSDTSLSGARRRLYERHRDGVAAA